MANVHDCEIIQLPKVTDRRGNLSFIEEERHVPFPIRRVFYIYDIPSGQTRGAHAHKTLHQFVVCLSGSLEVQLADGLVERTVRLNRPWIGLHIPPMIWANEANFDPGTVYVVLASELYDEADYIRDIKTFKALASEAR